MHEFPYISGPEIISSLFSDDAKLSISYSQMSDTLDLQQNLNSFSSG